MLQEGGVAPPSFRTQKMANEAQLRSLRLPISGLCQNCEMLKPFSKVVWCFFFFSNLFGAGSVLTSLSVASRLLTD